jgi:type I restriction enzyme S subunit
MAGEFSYTPLGELCDPARGITYGIVKVGDFVAGGVPVIRGGDIRNGRIVFDNEKRVTEEISQQFQRTILKGGEIVINLIAEPGHTAIVSPELAGANVSRDVGVIPLSDTVDHRYVDYCLKSPMAVHWLTSRLQGSVTQKVNLGTLRDLPIPTPGLDEQRAIAHVLGTLDDKIELSRRMSETLEVITRTLFKSWFVDFDPVRAKAEGRDPGLPQPLADLFPARLIDSDLGEIPEGWEVRRLGDLADIDKGLSYKGAGLAEDGGLPMVNLGCFAGGGIFKAENIKRYRGDYKDRHLVRSGDLVLANTDVTQQRVILGSPALVPELNGESRFLFTHHTFAFRFTNQSLI